MRELGALRAEIICPCLPTYWCQDSESVPVSNRSLCSATLHSSWLTSVAWGEQYTQTPIKKVRGVVNFLNLLHIWKSVFKTLDIKHQCMQIWNSWVTILFFFRRKVKVSLPCRCLTVAELKSKAKCLPGQPVLLLLPQPCLCVVRIFFL